MRKYVGITLMGVLFLSGCTLLGLGGPSEDATLVEAKAAQVLSIGTLDATVGYLERAASGTPTSGKEYSIVGLGGAVLYHGDSDEFTLKFSGNTSGKISVDGVSFQEYLEKKQDTTVEVSGYIEDENTKVTIRDVEFKFATIGKKYLDGELWYYPEGKPNGVRVYTSDL